ncbi:TIGR03943 family protein [Kitasatospora sp. GP82]|uniref:TIGR03943 family putative permease subunit n=1 Tax=Kitasatospora sp. GP82 TaxID=3035089 RepID=UPI002476FC90|nr:TIGR03943 family protein [Kitasatospora sp. GP82]
MRRFLPAALIVLTGSALLRVSLLSDLCLRYVKEGLRPFLVICGAVLVLLGAADALLRLRGTAADADTGNPGHDEDDDHGHGHAHAGSGLKTAWLLAVPAVLLLVAAPPALGSYAVARDGSGAIARRATFPLLPPQGPLALSLTDFITRAVWDDKESLKGRTVRLEGFVTPRPGGVWQLSRVIVSCCAADARVVEVEIHGLGTPQADTWVTVTGVWRPAPGARVPTLDATGLTVIPQPKNPYRDAPPAPDTQPSAAAGP